MTHSNPTIAVVMSTYNGADHLAEQIDSVLAQDVQNLVLYVRDDGSSDSTTSILSSYEREGKLIFIQGENKGAVGSFLELIGLVPTDIPYIALCDQDDVWHVDKLSRALSIIPTKPQDIPQLYCSEYMFCDAEMHQQGRSCLNQIGVDFPKMLFENMVSGNTVVINRPLADAVNAAGREGVYCHDWWLALLAAALGEITFDDFSSLEYRRTGSNVSPTGSGGLALLKYRIRTFFQKGELNNVIDQLELLNHSFGDQLGPQKKKLLVRMLHGNRLSKAFVPVRLRQKRKEEFALRLLFLLGKL